MKWGCEWNNKPNALQLKCGLRRSLIRNSIEPSSTGNCIHFDDALCEPIVLFDLTVKRNQTKEITRAENSYQVDSCETMHKELDQETSKELLGNVLYFWLHCEIFASKTESTRNVDLNCCLMLMIHTYSKL